MRSNRWRGLLGLGLGMGLALGAGCAGDDGGAPVADGGALADAGTGPQDILATALELDLATHAGRAVLTVTPAGGARVVALDVAGLTIDAVAVDGVAVAAALRAGELVVPVPGDAPVELAIDYHFADRAKGGFDGWMPDPGLTFLWPTYCDNLFPCDEDPRDGGRYSLAVSGVPDGAVAIYPATIPVDAPSYVPAIAVGAYQELALGTTAAGTEVSVFFLPGEDADAASGTAHLRDVVEFYETTYGPYRFGGALASVSAPWGSGGFGGMEHHPFVHVGSASLDSEEVHAHEAAHGWFGDGVRIECWEDFVLSEGTATYLAARALVAVGGPNPWPGYVAELSPLCSDGLTTAALPGSCGVIELIDHPLWSSVPYMRGACFFEEVADLIGEPTLDAALAGFYQAHAGGAARMEALIAALGDAAGAQAALVDGLADEWLRLEACPTDFAARCLD